MTRLPICLLVCGLGLGLGLAWPAGAGPAAAQPQTASGPDAPMPVLSDTPEYCKVLENRIAAQPRQTDLARQLLEEGHRLCDHGQVREGISRLRRALLILKHKQPEVIVQ